MIGVREAKQILETNLLKGKTSSMPLLAASGLVLAEDVRSPIDIPSFDNSAMDGYAIVWKRHSGTRKLLPNLTLKAGESNFWEISDEEAARIFTGAPVPAGADTVIPQEYVRVENGVISFEWEKFAKGANFRAKGAQNQKGDLIARKNTVVTPGMVGLLASVGIEDVSVITPPKVAILLTGDELVEIGNPLDFGKIYNANGPILVAYLNQLGIRDIRTEKAKDEPEKLQTIIGELLDKADVLIVSGGISVGEYDFVKQGLENEGVKQLFYKVKQKPGKPLWVGQKAGKWVFALPGNPASTLTCFNQYAKPCIEAWMGRNHTFAQKGSFPLANHFEKNSSLSFFLKVKVIDGEIVVLPGQESFNLIAYGEAGGIAEIPEETAFVPKGTMVNFYPW